MNRYGPSGAHDAPLAGRHDTGRTGARCSGCGATSRSATWSTTSTAVSGHTGCSPPGIAARWSSPSKPGFAAFETLCDGAPHLDACRRGAVLPISRWRWRELRGRGGVWRSPSGFGAGLVAVTRSRPGWAWKVKRSSGGSGSAFQTAGVHGQAVPLDAAVSRPSSVFRRRIVCI